MAGLGKSSRTGCLWGEYLVNVKARGGGGQFYLAFWMVKGETFLVIVLIIIVSLP